MPNPKLQISENHQQLATIQRACFVYVEKEAGSIRKIFSFTYEMTSQV